MLRSDLSPRCPQAVNFLAFAGFRAFLYGVVSAYIAQTFGLRTLGRVTGCVFTCGALVNLAQVGGNTPVQYAPYETSTYHPHFGVYETRTYGIV